MHPLKKKQPQNMQESALALIGNIVTSNLLTITVNSIFLFILLQRNPIYERIVTAILEKIYFAKLLLLNKTLDK